MGLDEHRGKPQDGHWDDESRHGRDAEQTGEIRPPHSARRPTRRELLARAGRAGLGLAAAAPLASWLAGCASTVSAGDSGPELDPSALNPNLDARTTLRQPHLNGEFPGALWVPTANFGYPDPGDRGRLGYFIHYIILHGTGWPATLDQYIAEASGANAPGVHYMVGKDGRVVQFIQEADASWGNGKVEPGADNFWRYWTTDNGNAMASTALGVVNPNLTTISIEHEKYAKDNQDPITPAQQAASFRLIAYLVAKYGIPPKRADGTDGGITGHNSMEPVTRSYCPGPYPWSELFAYLHAQPPAPTVPRPRRTPPGDDATR